LCCSCASCPFRLVGRGSVGRRSVYIVLNFYQVYAELLWLDVSWFHSQGIWIGRVVCQVITAGNSSCIIGRHSMKV